MEGSTMNDFPLYKSTLDEGDASKTTVTYATYSKSELVSISTGFFGPNPDEGLASIDECLRRLDGQVMAYAGGNFASILSLTHNTTTINENQRGEGYVVCEALVLGTILK